MDELTYRIIRVSITIGIVVIAIIVYFLLIVFSILIVNIVCDNEEVQDIIRQKKEKKIAEREKKEFMKHGIKVYEE